MQRKRSHRSGDSELSYHSLMLVSEIPALREFWYPVAYDTDLVGDPTQVRLFGEDYVVWRDGDRVAAALDMCPHRGARLSQGWVGDGCVTCPYHGWKFDADGTCVDVPQSPGLPIPARARLASVHAGERYGLVWMCVAEHPRAGIPDLPELDDPGYTLVHELMEDWDVCAPRCVDNALDVSHLSFVHRATVGDSGSPVLSDVLVERDGTSIRFSSSYTARVTPEMRRNTGLTGDTTTRTTRGELVQPLVFRGVLEYENGLRHVLYKTAAPIDDGRTLFCQFIARNDSPDSERQALMVDIDRRIQAEDKALLEGLPDDFPVQLATELHTKADRMTIEFRRVIADLAAESGPLRPDSTWYPPQMLDT